MALTGAAGTTGTYSRLRIFTANLNSAGGTVADGEVEDYYVTFVALLPVLISSFPAIKINSQVHLSWVAATEQNNRGFAIERRPDGVFFKQLDFVPSQAGHGISSQEVTY